MLKRVMLGFSAFVGLFIALCAVPASAQIGPGSPAAYLSCQLTPGPPPTWGPCTSSNPLQIAGSLTATLTPFTPSASGARGTPIAVTTSDSSGTLPTGTAVLVTNVGANPMYCNVNGVAATTSDQYIASGGGSYVFGVPAGVTVLHCIATAGSTTANIVGGSGLAAMTGGGSSSSGSNASVGATGSVAPSSATYVGIISGGNLVGWTGAVTNAGTFAVQATLQASATTAIGKVDPNTIGNWGLAASTQNGTTPTNGGLVMGQFNTTPATITSGNISPFQMDASGNLLVNIKAGAGSGGTALADQATFTQSTTSETPIGCLYTSSYTAGTTGKSTVMQCDSGGHPLVNPGTLATWGLAALTGATAPTNALAMAAEYLSSSPTYTTGQTGALQMTAAGSLHTTVDNTNANGAAAASASSPVTPANQPIGAANFAATQVSVTSSATSIVAQRTGVSGTGRVSVTITNTTTTALYLGGSGVTTSTGTLLPGIVGASVTINTTAAVYGISSGSSATVTAFETY